MTATHTKSKCAASRTHIGTLVAIAVIVMIAAALAGCATTPPSSGGVSGATAFSGTPAPAAARLVLLAVDNSRSTEFIRGRLLGGAFDIGADLSPQDTMRLLRFGHDIEELYAGQPADDDGLAAVLDKYAKPSDKILGTNYPLLAEYLANAAAGAPEKEVRIVILGDAENDFRADRACERRYRAAALRLARNPRVVWVRFWGADVGTREELRTVFQPLGRRLQILSMDQDPLAP